VLIRDCSNSSTRKIAWRSFEVASLFSLRTRVEFLPRRRANPYKNAKSNVEYLVGGHMKSLSIPLVLIGLLSGCALPTAEPPIDFLGDPASPTAATRTIVIKPDTRWVNVTGGETVRFVVGDKTFSWTFNVARNVLSFDLRRIAPPGILDHPVKVYVAPDPRYIGGGGGGRH
jgi:hypothetical protein